MKVEELSVRARNGLLNKFGHLPDPATVAANYSRRDLMRTPNFGKQSAYEIEGWLRLNGHEPFRGCCPHCGKRL